MAIEFEQRSEVVVDMVGFEQVRQTVFAALSVYRQEGKTDCHVVSWDNYPIDGQRTSIRFWLTQQNITDYEDMCNQQGGVYVSTRIMSPTDSGPPGTPNFDGIAPV